MLDCHCSLPLCPNTWNSSNHIWAVAEKYLRFANCAQVRSRCCFIIVYRCDSSCSLRLHFLAKNPAAFQDDLWCLFANLRINGASLIFAFSSHFIASFETKGVYVCTGQMTFNYLGRAPSKGLAVLVLTSAIIQVMLNIRIAIYKLGFTLLSSPM